MSALITRLRRLLGTEGSVIEQVGGEREKEREKKTYSRDWPNFAKALEAYKNPMVALAVDSIVGQILSTGFYFTSDDVRALRAVERWSEKVGLRGLLFDILRDLVLTGNCFLMPEGRGEDLVLHRLPLKFFTGNAVVAYDGPKTRFSSYELAVQVGSHYETIQLPADEVIHLAWNVLDPSVPWGYGLAYQLVTDTTDWMGRRVPNPLETEATLRRDIILYMDRSIPKRIIRFPGVGDDEMKATLIPQFHKILTDPGSDIITNKNIETGKLDPPGQLNIQYYIEFLENVFTTALRTPVIKLFAKPGFTEASAREAVSLFEVFVNAIREYVEHILETKIFPLVSSAGKIEIHWGQPKKPQLRIVDILMAARADAFSPALITPKEARMLLREAGWMIPTDTEAEEAFGRGRIVDGLKYVEIYLVQPDDVDRATVRYLTLDSMKGISLAVAYVKSTKDRRPVALFFDKGVYPWTPEKARDYYLDVFPTALSQLQYI